MRVRNFLCLAMALIASVGAAAAAQATVVTYNGFASTTGLTLVGSATTTSDGTGRCCG